MYSKLMAPLEQLRHSESIEWTTDLQSIMDKVRNILSSNLVLSYPDFDKEFHVATDASNHGIGAVLYQEVDGKRKYVSFSARAITTSESGYGSTKRELLAIIFALKQFRPYLFGSPFKLYTDHKALIFMFTQKHLNQMLENWLETLLSLDFTVYHRPGIKNILPDKLSRFYDSDPIPSQQESSIMHLEQEVPIHSRDPLESTVVPLELRQDLLHRAHLCGHFGITSMLKTLQNAGHIWPNMIGNISTIVKQCTECNRYNIGKHGFSDAVV